MKTVVKRARRVRGALRQKDVKVLQGMDRRLRAEYDRLRDVKWDCVVTPRLWMMLCAAEDSVLAAMTRVEKTLAYDADLRSRGGA